MVRRERTIKNIKGGTGHSLERISRYYMIPDQDPSNPNVEPKPFMLKITGLNTGGRPDSSNNDYSLSLYLPTGSTPVIETDEYFLFDLTYSITPEFKYYYVTKRIDYLSSGAYNLVYTVYQETATPTNITYVAFNGFQLGQRFVFRDKSFQNGSFSRIMAGGTRTHYCYNYVDILFSHNKSTSSIVTSGSIQYPTRPVDNGAEYIGPNPLYAGMIGMNHYVEQSDLLSFYATNAPLLYDIILDSGIDVSLNFFKTLNPIVLNLNVWN